MNFSPIFALLQQSATIPSRKVFAALLLLLFAVIHVVKLFHHHNDAACVSHFQIDKKAILKSQTACAICDYHLTKDADVVTNPVVAQPPLTYLSVRFFYILSSTTSIGLPGTDRGPPALV